MKFGLGSVTSTARTKHYGAIVMQIYTQDKDKKLSGIIGKIYFCETLEGKQFCSKLIETDGDCLFFATKSGRVIMNRLSTLRIMNEVA